MAVPADVLALYRRGSSVWFRALVDSSCPDQWAYWSCVRRVVARGRSAADRPDRQDHPKWLTEVKNRGNGRMLARGCTSARQPDSVRTKDRRVASAQAASD